MQNGMRTSNKKLHSNLMTVISRLRTGRIRRCHTFLPVFETSPRGRQGRARGKICSYPNTKPRSPRTNPPQCTIATRNPNSKRVMHQALLTAARCASICSESSGSKIPRRPHRRRDLPRDPTKKVAQ